MVRCWMLLLAVICAMVMSAYAKELRPFYDCADHVKRKSRFSTKSKLTPIQIRETDEKIRVWCDMDTDRGGWTVIQRRVDGKENFDRDWKAYKEGFGDKKGEFWLGLQYIHALTKSNRQVLRIDMEDWDGKKAFAQFNDFEIDEEDRNYRFLRIGTYSGNAGDAMTYELFREFSTKDRDHDMWSGNCALKHHAGWWFNKCSESLLNGMYKKGAHKGDIAGVEWEPWRGFDYSLKKVEMKIRTFY